MLCKYFHQGYIQYNQVLFRLLPPQLTTKYSRFPNES